MVGDDENSLIQVLATQGYNLTARSDEGGAARNVIYRETFEELNDASAIRADIRRIGDRLKKFSGLSDVPIRLTLGLSSRSRMTGKSQSTSPSQRVRGCQFNVAPP